MAVAMAACSLGLHFTAADNNNLRAFEKTTLLKASSISDATKLCYITHKTRYANYNFHSLVYTNIYILVQTCSAQIYIYRIALYLVPLLSSAKKKLFV